MEEEKKNHQTSHYWWFDSHNNSNTKRSAWLYSTLSELEGKTQAMLEVINEDADSFAKRAEMYYKKRRELINMVEDFYRSHRSLAERYDLVKSGTERSTTAQEKLYDRYFDAYELFESEVDDPELGQEVVEVQVQTEMRKVEISSVVVDDEVTKLKEEIESLKLANSIQMDQLVEKDEEKREVIRQLSLAMNMLREENSNLRQISKKAGTPKKQKSIECNNKLKEGFRKKLYDGSQEHKFFITM